MKGLEAVIFPRILDGEFLGGYVARVATGNGLRRTEDLAMRASRSADRRSSLEGTILDRIHARLGVDLDVVRRHSVMNAILRDCQVGHQRKPRHFAWLKPGKNQPAFCPRCAREDLAQRGFTYWRRDHQLPGSFLCQKHDAALATSPAALSCSTMPHHALDHARAAASEVIDRLRANRHVCNFLAILAHVSARPVTDDWEAAKRQREILRIQKMGLEASIQRAYPAEWLQSVMPFAVLQRPGVKPAFAALAGEQVSKVGMSLVAALAYPSAGDAIAVLYGEERQLRLFTDSSPASSSS